jgi:hypothetical protein
MQHIHVEEANGRAAGSRESDDVAALLKKMCRPNIATWMKQWNCVATSGVNSRQVRPLVQIASFACQREI